MYGVTQRCCQERAEVRALNTHKQTQLCIIDTIMYVHHEMHIVRNVDVTQNSELVWLKSWQSVPGAVLLNLGYA
jgi:hypothetical protein